MPKADLNKAGWEQSEFPILCETCVYTSKCVLTLELTKCCIPGLGDNPFIRMVCSLLFSFNWTLLTGFSD